IAVRRDPAWQVGLVPQRVAEDAALEVPRHQRREGAEARRLWPVVAQPLVTTRLVLRRAGDRDLGPYAVAQRAVDRVVPRQEAVLVPEGPARRLVVAPEDVEPHPGDPEGLGLGVALGQVVGPKAPVEEDRVVLDGDRGARARRLGGR